jgi:hypothetical protein
MAGDHRFGRMTSAPWLAVTAAVTLIALAGCGLVHEVTGPFRHPPIPEWPCPQKRLMLWLEGGGSLVVRRPGPRFDNYFQMTCGTGSQIGAGGTGCTANTVLHLGWCGTA